jgi:hypothetical protein
MVKRKLNNGVSYITSRERSLALAETSYYLEDQAFRVWLAVCFNTVT